MSNYWVDRFTAEENRINELSKEQVKEAKKQYDIALKNTNQKIYEFYAKYAKDNNISMYEAKQRFNKKELKEFKMSLSEYVRKGQSLNISPDDNIIKELKNVSSRVHIERLEALKMEIKAEIDLLSKTMENNLDKHLREVYRDTYYRSAYSIQKGLDKFSNIEKLNSELLESLVYKPWTKDNTNWSKRIWGNDGKLVNTLHTNLTQNIITGKPLKDIIDTIEERFNVERNIATRLIMTESAAYHSRAKERCMKDLGCEKYEVIATLDDRTSSICRSMDGKVFDMKDYQVGVTASPFHANCRTVTAPYYDKIEGDINLRASRKEDDDYELVDVKDYQDWYDNYVEKGIQKSYSKLDGTKTNLESKNKSDIIKSRNATIDKEIKENVLKDIKHNSGLGTVGKKILKNIDLDENLEFVISNNRGSVKASYDIELTKSKKIMYRRKFEEMKLSLNDGRNLYYREKTIFHESYHAMLDNKLVDVHFSDVDFIEKWRDIEEVFAESSGHYLTDLVGNKSNLGVSYPQKIAEVLPRLKKFRKFKECKTISDFGRIAYYERYKGKNAIWIPIRDVIFKQEFDILEYSKQYIDYIEKNKSKIFTLIYKNAPDILSKEEAREIIDEGTEIIKNATSFNNLTDSEKEIFYNVLVSAMKLKGVK
jgi:SPP1 gp7 family putative phage head morphogenesis protein